MPIFRTSRIEIRHINRGAAGVTTMRASVAGCVQKACIHPESSYTVGIVGRWSLSTACTSFTNYAAISKAAGLNAYADQRDGVVPGAPAWSKYSTVGKVVEGGASAIVAGQSWFGPRTLADRVEIRAAGNRFEESGHGNRSEANYQKRLASND